MSTMHVFIWCSLRCSFHSKMLQVDSFFRSVVKNNDPPCITVLWKPGIYNRGGKMSRSAESGGSNRRRWKEKRAVELSHSENHPRNKKYMHFIYLFLNHVVILRNHHWLLLKGKGWFLKHTHTHTHTEGNGVVLLKTADVNSGPRRHCVKSTPPTREQRFISRVSHSKCAASIVHYVMISSVHTLTRRFHLLVSTIKTEFCTNPDFRSASGQRWTDFCL